MAKQKFITCREFDSWREVVKDDFKEIKGEIKEIKNNHLPHIYKELREIRKDYHSLATKIAGITATVTLLVSILIKSWGII